MAASKKTQRKSTRKTTTRRKKTVENTVPAWVRYSGIFMIMIAVAGVAYVHYHGKSLKERIEKTKHANAKHQITPSFDFYELLPNIEVPVASSAPSNANHAVSPKRKAAMPEKKLYVLQVASFQHFKDADELKARLALSGFDVNVHHFQDKQKRDWYRIWIGPYSKKQLALTDQTKLKKQAITSLLLSRRV